MTRTVDRFGRPCTKLSEDPVALNSLLILYRCARTVSATSARRWLGRHKTALIRDSRERESASQLAKTYIESYMGPHKDSAASLDDS